MLSASYAEVPVRGHLACQHAQHKENAPSSHRFGAFSYLLRDDIGADGRI